MAGEDELMQAIEQNALGPAKASGDTGSFEQHSVDEQIKLHKYKAALAAQDSATPILHPRKIVSPGAS